MLKAALCLKRVKIQGRHKMFKYLILGATTAGLALSGCTNEAQLPADTGSEVAIEAPIPEIETVDVDAFNADHFGHGAFASPLQSQPLIEVAPDGLVMSVNGAQPTVSLKQTFDFNPLAIYEVSVTFEALSTQGEPHFNVIAWSLDYEGKKTSQSGYTPFFLKLDPEQTNGPQTITARFSATPVPGEKVLPVVDIDTVKNLRFDANPMRGGTGSIAKVTDFTVSVKDRE